MTFKAFWDFSNLNSYHFVFSDAAVDCFEMLMPKKRGALLQSISNCKNSTQITCVEICDKFQTDTSPIFVWYLNIIIIQAQYKFGILDKRTYSSYSWIFHIEFEPFNLWMFRIVLYHIHHLFHGQCFGLIFTLFSASIVQ